MIKKTLISTLLILTGYCFFIMKLIPDKQVAQHHWQENRIRAQNFIYDERDSVDNVIVGSSYAWRMMMDSLNGYTNLAFGGQGSLDGLNILLYKEDLPRNVFVEIQGVFAAENKEFISSLSNPLFFRVRQYVPALREGRQPITLLGIPAAYLIGGSVARVKKIFSQDTGDKQNTLLQNDLFLKSLSRQFEMYSKEPGPDTIQKTFDRLKQYIGILEQKKVNIIFFEMPVYKSLCGLPRSKAIREAFFKYFPRGKYRYIPQPDCREYKTTDGVHLDREDAIRYTRYFKNAISNNYPD